MTDKWRARLEAKAWYSQTSIDGCLERLLRVSDAHAILLEAREILTIDHGLREASLLKERDEARAERDARPTPEVVAKVIRSLSQLHDFAAVYSPSSNTDMLVEAREALRLLEAK